MSNHILINSKKRQIRLRKRLGMRTHKQEEQLRGLINEELRNCKPQKPRYRVPAIFAPRLAREIGNPNHRAVK